MEGELLDGWGLDCEDAHERRKEYVMAVGMEDARVRGRGHEEVSTGCPEAEMEAGVLELGVSMGP